MLNVVVKTALKTLLGVIIALLVAFAIASLGFPGSMASLFEKWGNYSLATGYSSLNYSYTGNVEDLARCYQNSILAENDGDIVNYGDKLVADEKFSELCEKKNGQLESVTDYPIDYKQYVYGTLACAKYAQGDKDGALKAAKSGAEGQTGFPAGNALAQLAVPVIEGKDKDTASKLLEAIEPYQTQEGYFTAVKTLLENTVNN